MTEHQKNYSDSFQGYDNWRYLSFSRRIKVVEFKCAIFAG